jgi:predicted DsbA family dithiol-disulfide isomerase
MADYDRAMRVDVWSDIVCPWCYLGKARFERALAEFEHRDQVQVVHHAFELDPGFPTGQATSVLDMLSSKYGLSRDQAAEAEANMAQMAAAEGLEFSIDRPHGNTFDAHRLVHLAKDRGRQDEMLSRLYRANFGAERSVFDTESLSALADEVGLDPAETRKVLAGDDYTEEVRADERRAAELGATGVPFFVIDDALGISGGQRAEVFLRALRQAWDDGHPSADDGTSRFVSEDA